MASRYLVTGVQLGMIKACLGKNAKHKACDRIVDQILKNQFIDVSHDNIEEDVEKVARCFGEKNDDNTTKSCDDHAVGN